MSTYNMTSAIANPSVKVNWPRATRVISRFCLHSNNLTSESSRNVAIKTFYRLSAPNEYGLTRVKKTLIQASRVQRSIPQLIKATGLLQRSDVLLVNEIVCLAGMQIRHLSRNGKLYKLPIHNRTQPRDTGITLIQSRSVFSETL
jgi:hypothetical protein